MTTSTHMASETKNVPVLIVGGSLVGLSTSLFLSWHGIPSLLVERHGATSPFPRAGGFNARTMEIFRTVGVETAINRVVPPATKIGESLRVESLESEKEDWVLPGITGNESTLSPVSFRFIPQSQLEPLLQARAQELGSALSFNTELVSFEQDSAGVKALMRDALSGEEYVVRARYLVAADGNRSPVRECLGIKQHGPGVLGQQISIIFKADLRSALRGRHIFLCYITNPAVQGVLGIAPDGQNGALVISRSAEQDEVEEDFSGERGIAAVRTAVGQADLPVQIWETVHWKMAALTAEHFQEGNVFLAGDAAHVMPPTGGFGANTGISDAYNLAWKLTFVLKGLAGQDLLTSYDGERRPVADFTVGQAYALSRTRLAADTDNRSVLTNELQDHETIVFGYQYQSNAILIETDTDEEQEWLLENPHRPSGHTGSRAPHIQLEQNQQQLSTLDLFGRNFVLLTGDASTVWQTAAPAVAARLRIMLDVYQIGGNADLVDKQGDFLSSYGIQAGGATLIRPDGYIAWRSQTIVTADRLEQVMIKLLSRD